MSNSSSQYLYSVARQALHELKYLGLKALQKLMKTPLPRILLVAIAVVLCFALIPLVLSLFIVFLLGKLLILTLIIILRNNKNQPAQIVRSKYRRDQ